MIVIDGREELVAEVREADKDIRSFIAKQLTDLQNHYDYDGFLEGNIRGPDGRADIIRDRLAALVASSDWG